MTPIRTPECNGQFKAPEGLTESQVATVHAHMSPIIGGSCDGLTQIVIAYEPTDAEREKIANGGLIYLSCIGALPPHYLSTSFEEATHPA